MKPVIIKLSEFIQQNTEITNDYMNIFRAEYCINQATRNDKLHFDLTQK